MPVEFLVNYLINLYSLNRELHSKKSFQNDRCRPFQLVERLLVILYWTVSLKGPEELVPFLRVAVPMRGSGKWKSRRVERNGARGLESGLGCVHFIFKETLQVLALNMSQEKEHVTLHGILLILCCYHAWPHFLPQFLASFIRKLCPSAAFDNSKQPRPFSEPMTTAEIVLSL